MSRFGGFLGGSGLPDPSNFNSAAPGIYSLDEAEAFRRLGYWPLKETRDPYFAVTQFILSADGQLKDTSANAATLTTVGFTRQKVDGPAGKPISAAYNSAGNAYIRPADSANLIIGTGDYTLECWVWPTGQGNNDQPLFDTRNTSNGQGGTYFGFRNSDGAVLADGAYSFGTGSVQVRQWNHVSFVRENGQLRVYVNGVQQGSAVVSTLNHTSGTLVVGGYSYSPVGVNPLIGYIADARATIGAPRYSTTYTPDTAPAPIVQELIPPYAPTLGDAFYGNQSVALNWRNAFNGGSDLTDFDIEYSTASDMSGGTIVNVPVGGAGPYGFSSPTTFTKPDNDTTADVLIPGVLEITRTNQYAIYNSAVQSAWPNSNKPQNPANTEWALGWSSECDVATKTFGNFTDLWGGGGVGSNIVNAELVMRHVPTGRIWFIKFSSWTSMAGGGGFVYERREFYGCLNLPTAHTVTGLTNDTPYYFRVRANNAVGSGAYSSIVGPLTPSSILPQRLIGGDVGSAPGDDPDAYKVALLLHFDGADGSTAFPDSSNANRTLSVSGDAQISTAQSAFSGAAAEGWDISTASFSQSFSVAAQETAPAGVFFKPDGLKMYIIGSTGDDVNEYDLATAWDISTASYLRVYSVSSQEKIPTGIFFRPDGLRMYVTGAEGPVDDENELATVYQYALSSAWDISTASYLSQINVGDRPRGITFTPDGANMYLAIPAFAPSPTTVRRYALSTPWDVTSVPLDAFSRAAPLQTLDVSAQDTSPQDVQFRPDGLKMYVLGAQGDDVTEYTLTTAWDLSTATAGQTFSVLTQDNSGMGLYFREDGLKMYIVGSTSDAVHEYTLAATSGGSPGTSGLFDGTGDFLTLANNSALLFDSGDYTVETWIYPTDASGTKWIAGIWSYTNSASQAWGLYIDNGVYKFVIDPQDNVINTSTSAPVLNQWTHIACTRSGNVFRMFINGVKESEATLSSFTMQNGTGSFHIATTESAPGGTQFVGHIDELRITKGVSRYNANFTPPTAPFPDPPVPPEYFGVSFKQDDYSESTALATKIFDGSLAANTTNQWRTNNLNRSFAVDFGTTQEILRYRMWRNTNNDGTPTHWLLQGSNTQSDWDNLQNNTGQATFGSWTTIDTRTAVNLPKVTGSTPATQPYGEFVVADPDAYRYYRLFVSNVRADGPGNTTNRIFLAEMQLSAVVTPAAVPTNFSAVPTSDGANLSWAYAGMRDNFEVEWASDAAFTSVLGTTTVTGLVATITGLTIGTTYYARVRATNSAGTSAYTTAESFTPAAGYSPNSDNILRFRLDDQSTAAYAYIWTTTGYAKLVSSTGETSAVAGRGLNPGGWGNNYWAAYSISPSITGLATGTERMISVISCDASGTPSGEIEFIDFSYAPPSSGIQRINLIDLSGCTSLKGCLAVSSTSGIGVGGFMGPPSPTALPSTITEVRAVGIGQALINSFSNTNPYPWNGYITGYMYAGLGVAGQQLSAAALNQLYTDLVTRSSGSGSIAVHNNPGTAADDPTIATGKGYTVYGS